MRYSKTECKNYKMTEAEIDFVRKDNIKSTQKRHIQNLQTRTNPFLNGVVNPVFVRHLHKQGLKALYFDNYETLPTTKTTLSSELTTTLTP